MKNTNITRAASLCLNSLTPKRLHSAGPDYLVPWILTQCGHMLTTNESWEIPRALNIVDLDK